MAIGSPELSLPTLTRLNVELPQQIDAISVASEWFDQFAQCLGKKDIKGVTALLIDGTFWRDTLALTWDFRTFHGTTKIEHFLSDVLAPSSESRDSANELSLSNFSLDKSKVSLQTPYPDLAWIQGLFTFETSTGIGSGVFRLVPTSSSTWKAHVIYTNLEELKGFSELVGRHRSTADNHGDDWLAERLNELSFEDTEPAVVIIGGGHCGLEVAARLKYLGVSNLVVERQPRIGDSWRIRYEALSLHDPVHYIHMPYLPFPSTWPLWTPSPKIADWLEHYAKALDLNVWTGSNVDRVEEGVLPGQDPWRVFISTSGGGQRILRPRHVVFATSIFGPPRVPKFAGTENFEGKLIHTTQYKTAREHTDKKVVVIGACTSGHDVALDHGKRGIDVTMVQRESTYIMSTKYGVTTFQKGAYGDDTPPPDVSDRIGASFPSYLTKLLHQRQAPAIAELDKETLDGLKKRGFKLNMGEDNSGVIMLFLRRGGGFYFDTGACQMIIDGKVKLKNDSTISRFVKNGIEFEDGSFLPADVVILATGYEGTKEHLKTLVSDDVVERINTIWGLNDEGELNTVFRYSGVPGLYFAMGNFQQTRYYSKLLALQIKAHEENLFGRRYSH